jgi:hypothetical protein
LQPLKLIDNIYTTVIKVFHNRHYRPIKDPVLPDTILKAFQERQQWSRRYKVYQAGNSIYQVEVPDTGIKYIVSLARRSCDCTNFQWYQSPCAHAIAACCWAETDLYKFFWKYYKVRVYRDTYSEFLQPFPIQDLATSEYIYPPIVRRQRGRPKSKRIRKGDHKRKQKKYSTCREKGHDKRSCRNQPVANGRRQRARDRVLSSSSDSAPDLHQDQIEEETDDNWAEEDLQIQAQIQLLDERLSRHDEWWAGEVAKAGERAAVAAEEHLSQGPIESAGEEGDNSSLSTVSSSRYEGLEEEW